ncbi:hypothetical protein Lal_00001403 [Lupinus albus]|nr:hypothetical protein Lal_00001403 [Lupinus albus]
MVGLIPYDYTVKALNPLEPIGSFGGRNFVLSKKNLPSTMTEPQSKLKTSKSKGGMKKFLNKLFISKIENYILN